MQKKILTTCIFVLLMFILPDAVRSQTVCKRYGGDETEYAFQMIRDPDGHYVMTGRTYSFQVTPGQAWGDIYTICLDTSFHLHWTSVFQTPLEDEGSAIVNAYGGGYLVAGASYNNISGYDITLVRLDTGGNLTWSKLLGSELNEQAEVLIRTSNDDYVVAGYADSLFSVQAQSFVPFIARLSSNGSVIWARRFGFTSGVFAGSVYDVIEAPDGSLLVTGDIIRMFQGADDSDIFLARFSSSGTLLWFKWLGTDCQGCHEMGACLVSDGPEKFTLIASSGPYNGLYACRFDLTGNISPAWGIPTGTFAYSNISAEKTTDGGTIIACPAMSNMLVMKTDSTHTIEWSSVYGDGTSNIPCTIMKKDAGYLLGGYTGWAGPYREDYMLAVIDSMGYSCCMIHEHPLTATSLQLPDSSGGGAFVMNLLENPAGMTTTGGVERPVCSDITGIPESMMKGLTCYPNPFHDYLTLSFDDGNPHHLRLYNASGKLVRNVLIRKKAGIPTHDLPAGVYYLQSDQQTCIKVIRY